jgi:hypothetical protein
MELSPVRILGACLGLRQGLESVVLFLPPSIAIGLMLLTANNSRHVPCCRCSGSIAHSACRLFNAISREEAVWLT